MTNLLIKNLGVDVRTIEDLGLRYVEVHGELQPSNNGGSKGHTKIIWQKLAVYGYFSI